METWYLIIILGTGGYQTGSSQQTVEFKNEDACIVVMEHLTEKYPSNTNTIICVKDQ
jgi:hypothetical protein